MSQSSSSSSSYLEKEEKKYDGIEDTSDDDDENFDDTEVAIIFLGTNAGLVALLSRLHNVCIIDDAHDKKKI
jgi:hypothetical protein